MKKKTDNAQKLLKEKPIIKTPNIYYRTKNFNYFLNSGINLIGVHTRNLSQIHKKEYIDETKWNEITERSSNTIKKLQEGIYQNINGTFVLNTKMFETQNINSKAKINKKLKKFSKLFSSLSPEPKPHKNLNKNTIKTKNNKLDITHKICKTRKNVSLIPTLFDSKIVPNRTIQTLFHQKLNKQSTINSISSKTSSTHGKTVSSLFFPSRFDTLSS